MRKLRCYDFYAYKRNIYKIYISQGRVYLILHTHTTIIMHDISYYLIIIAQYFPIMNDDWTIFSKPSDKDINTYMCNLYICV